MNQTEAEEKAAMLIAIADNQNSYYSAFSTSQLVEKASIANLKKRLKSQISEVSRINSALQVRIERASVNVNKLEAQLI